MRYVSMYSQLGSINGATIAGLHSNLQSAFNTRQPSASSHNVQSTMVGLVSHGYSPSFSQPQAPKSNLVHATNNPVLAGTDPYRNAPVSTMRKAIYNPVVTQPNNPFSTGFNFNNFSNRFGFGNPANTISQVY